MRKSIAALFAASMIISFAVPANASAPQSVVIIDSGFDLSSISNNVVQEVCITSSGCNDGSSLQVGPGSAQTNIAIAPRFAQDWSHGTLMAQTAIAVNPNINLILIRTGRVYNTGNILFGNEAVLESVLNWVYQNADAYNIIAVSMSRGSHSYVLDNATARKQLTYLQVYGLQLEKMNNQSKFAASIKAFTKRLNDAIVVMNALPNIDCPASNTLKTLVTQLKIKNIATMFATGNDSNSRYVDSPACIDDAVAVAASANGKVLLRSNVAPNTDFAVDAPNTSTATAKLAAKWSLVYNNNYETTYNSIKNSGITLDRYNVVGVN